MERKWFASEASIIAATTVLLHSIGFLTANAFNAVLGLPGGFFDDSPTAYLLWGAKAVIPIITVLIFFTIAIASVLLLGKMAYGVLSFIATPIIHPLKSLATHLRTRFLRMLEARTAGTISGVFFMMTLAALIAVTSWFSDIIDPCTRLPDPSLPLSQSTAVFETANRAHHNAYLATFAFFFMLIIAGFAALHTYLRERKKNSTVAVVYRAGTIAIILIFVALMAIPYRILHYNECELIAFEQKPAFLVAEKKDEYLLYLPNEHPFVVDRADTRVYRYPERAFVNIFDTAGVRDAIAHPPGHRP